MKCEVCHKPGKHHVHLGVRICRECRIAQIEGLSRPFLAAEQPGISLAEAERRVREGIARDRKTNKSLDTVLRVVEAMRVVRRSGETGTEFDDFA